MRATDVKIEYCRPGGEVITTETIADVAAVAAIAAGVGQEGLAFVRLTWGDVRLDADMPGHEVTDA